MRYAVWVIAALIASGALLTVRDVGKPRKPLTGASAAAVVLVSAAFASVLVIAGLHL